MNKKIGFVSLGCPKNLVDTEIMLGLIKEKYELTTVKEDADAIVINTCGFIDSAKEESVNTILEMSALKEFNCKVLIVTGCMAERYKDEILKDIPEVDGVIGTGGYHRILEVLEEAFLSKEKGKDQKVTFKNDAFKPDYLNKERVISTGKGFAYLKVAEGCDNHCTYCVIPSLRGPFISRPMEDITEEATKLAQKGIKELVLVAQDVTRYGVDLYKDKKLVELVERLSQIDKIEWIRLLYCYPEEIDQRLIDLIASNPKVVKYIDVPIQHISDNILKLMGRRGNKEGIEKVLCDLRSKIPDIIIRTSLIVGFPGEENSDFKMLYDFVRKFEFNRLGVFTYSKEDGTPASKMKAQIKKTVKDSRQRDIMQIQKEINLQKNLDRQDKYYKTLVEGISDQEEYFYVGRTYAEAPDIDGVVYFTSEQPLEIGQFVTVKILNIDNYDLIGEVVNESSK